MKTLCSLLCSVLFISAILSAQSTSPEYLRIRGKIIDQKTKAPLPFAHVGIPEKGIGTTSGNDGVFLLNIPIAYAKSTLEVSYIGYSNYKKPLTSITSPVTIQMEQKASDLVEVVVMGESAVENIIRQAVKKIPDNYPIHPTKVLGFYRESRTDDSLNYIYLAEGVLDVYKTSYRNKKEGMIGLVHGRKMNLENPLDTTFHSTFTSGHMAAHRFDFVKNRIDFIDERFFPAYKYWVEKITYYNDRPVFIIGFAPNEEARNLGSIDDDQNSDDFGDGGALSTVIKIFGGKSKRKTAIKGRMKGRIYIEQESYAFVRAEFEITKKGLKKYNYYPLYAGSWDANSYVVNYRQLEEKWYFSDAVREGLYGGGGTYNNEIKITEINPEKAKSIPYLDRLQRGDAFTRMTGEYDEDFWKSYNTTPLSEELAESVQQLATIRKAQEAFSQENMEKIQQQRDSLQRIETLRAQVEREEGLLDEDIDFRYGEPGIKPTKRTYSKVEFGIGVGTHLIQTTPGQMGINYNTEATDFPENILSLSEDVNNRSFEIIANWDFDIYLRKALFLRFGTGFDFTNSIYKERTVGLGTRLNLSKQRPFYAKVLAQYSHLRYYRKVGSARNDYGKFEVDGKNFNAPDINLYYGSRSHNLKASVELSIELARHKQAYIRGSFALPFARKQAVYFKERKQLFKKKENLAVSDRRLIVSQNDQPFEGQLMPDQTFSISIGYLFF